LICVGYTIFVVHILLFTRLVATGNSVISKLIARMHWIVQ